MAGNGLAPIAAGINITVVTRRYTDNTTSTAQIAPAHMSSTEPTATPQPGSHHLPASTGKINGLLSDAFPFRSPIIAALDEIRLENRKLQDMLLQATLAQTEELKRVYELALSTAVYWRMQNLRKATKSDFIFTPLAERDHVDAAISLEILSKGISCCQPGSETDTDTELPPPPPQKKRRIRKRKTVPPSNVYRQQPPPPPPATPQLPVRSSDRVPQVRDHFGGWRPRAPLHTIY